jgi:lipid-A-disaccharide synthase
MRRLADRVLCTLPFEEQWYRQRGVEACYVGHPYFDELHGRRLDEAFLAEQARRPGPVVALLPGSRRQEIAHNTDAILDAAALVHARRPDVRFLAACLRPEHVQSVQERLRGRALPIEAHAGRTAEVLHLAHCAIAKSGSVGLEMLYHGTPAVIVYQLGWLEHWVATRFLIKCPYISLVNLLADRPLFPEYLAPRLPVQAMADHVLRWLEDKAAYAAVRAELAALRDRIAVPGACDRAAEVVLEVLAGGKAVRRAG